MPDVGDGKEAYLLVMAYPRFFFIKAISYSDSTVITSNLLKFSCNCFSNSSLILSALLVLLCG